MYLLSVFQSWDNINGTSVFILKESGLYPETLRKTRDVWCGMESMVHLDPKSNDQQPPQAQPFGGDAAAGAGRAPRSPYRRGARWVMAAGASAIVGGGWLSYQRFFQSAPRPVAVSLIPVTRDTVEVTINESGTVALGGEQTLKSPEDVTVEQVFVQPGDRVKVGDPLIVLRNRNDQQLQKTQVVENQKAMLDLVRRREIVREQQAKLQNAEQRLRESQDLLRQGFIAETDLQDDQDKVSAARAAVRDAEIEARKAELEVQKGQSALQEIRQRLGDNRLNSPMNALILRVDVNPGDGAKREANLLTLGDPAREMVDLQLTTLNAAKVRINQVARVSMIGPNPKKFLGRVIVLSPQASSQKSDNSFGSQPQAKVDASVALDRPSNTLIPGSQVSVEIVLNQRRNVLTLPLEAIQELETNPFVWVKNRAGQAEKRSVKLGLQSLTTVEIIAGVQAGESVALPTPNQTLTPGTQLQDSPTPIATPPATP